MDIEAVEHHIGRYERSITTATTKMLEKTNDCDSERDWLSKVINTEPELCASLGLPASKGRRKALLSILEGDTHVSSPISCLLADRVGIYLHLLPEIANHPVASQEVREVLEMVRVIKNLTKTAKTAHTPFNISAVSKALRSHSLHFFRNQWVDTDLKVVLRTFYESKGLDRQSAETVELLEFVKGQLEEESKHPGHIPEPRHAWWAIATLCECRGSQWLQDNKELVEKMIRGLLAKPNYAPRKDVEGSSIAPELLSPQNEKQWESINICRILRSLSIAGINADLYETLEKQLMLNYDLLFTVDIPVFFRETTQNLLLLYETYMYLDRQRYIAFTLNKTIRLEDFRIGSYYYSRRIVTKARAMLEKADVYLSDISKWTSPTTTSAILCALPGQGKTELMRQLTSEVEQLAKSHGQRIKTFAYKVGKDVHSETDLQNILDAIENERTNKPQSVVVVQFDEIDKASFNLPLKFLDPLECKIEPGKSAVTFWLFAQSAFPSLDDYEKHAEETLKKNRDSSLRDFLSRIRWGSIELPELRLSSEQRIMSAIGMACQAFPSTRRLSAYWIAYFMSNRGLPSNRELRSEVTTKSELTNNRLETSERTNSPISLEDGQKGGDYKLILP